MFLGFFSLGCTTKSEPGSEHHVIASCAGTCSMMSSVLFEFFESFLEWFC